MDMLSADVSVGNRSSSLVLVICINGSSIGFSIFCMW